MQIIIGKYLGKAVRRVEPRSGDTWQAFDKHALSLLIERPDAPPYIAEVEVGERDRRLAFSLDELPAEGELVALEFSVSARASKDRAFMTYRAWRVLPGEYAEALLSGARA